MIQRDLVERARQGDHDAFAALAGAAIARLDAAARLILRDRDRAQDAVQEAFLRAWRDLPGLRDPERFNAWLYRLLARACYDEIRHSRRRPIEVEITNLEIASASDGLSATADRDQLERALRRLEPEQRALVVMHHYLGLPLPEAAEALNIPLGTAKSRLSRSLGALRTALGEPQRQPELTEGRFA